MDPNYPYGEMPSRPAPRIGSIDFGPAALTEPTSIPAARRAESLPRRIVAAAARPGRWWAHRLAWRRAYRSYIADNEARYRAWLDDLPNSP